MTFSPLPPSQQIKWRLLLFVFGVLILIAACTYPFFMLPGSTQLWDDMDSPHVTPLYIATLKKPEMDTKIPALEQDQTKKKNALMVMEMRDVTSGTQRLFQVLHPNMPPGTEQAEPLLSESQLDFDPDRVMQAYKKTDEDSFFVHHYCDGYYFEQGQTQSMGKFLILFVRGDDFVDQQQLTIYSYKDGKLLLYFYMEQYSHRRQWTFPDKNYEELLVVANGHKVAGYRWNGVRYTWDDSVRVKYADQARKLIRGGTVASIISTSLFLFLLIPFVWGYYILKLIVLSIFHLRDRPFGCLRFLVGGLFSLWIFAIFMFSGMFGSPDDNSVLNHIGLLGSACVVLAIILPPPHGLGAQRQQASAKTE